jgi:uncharacterized membrane protein (UPF0127 family)
MPKANPKKIKSELRSSSLFRVGVVWALAAAGFVLFLILSAQNMTVTSGRPSAFLQGANQKYQLDIANTTELRTQGLSGRGTLPAGRGMLFTFSSQQQRCFWMKDMQFAIDIIWVGADKKVTYIQSNLKPETYPQEYCAKAQYVIELGAGEASKNKFKVSSTLNFDDPTN